MMYQPKYSLYRDKMNPESSIESILNYYEQMSQSSQSGLASIWFSIDEKTHNVARKLK